MRRATVAVMALTLGLAALAPAALAHQGNPNMQSVVRALHPRTPGVSIQVLSRDDRFELTNRSRVPILVHGYSGEPYARVLPDGTVQVNDRSPAYHLNQDRIGNVAVPASASATAAPHWVTLDKTGVFQWHDHRMHYMGTGVPSQVTDRSKRQKVFDYAIPVRVGAREGRILGTLWWTPAAGGGPPTAAVIGLLAIVLAGGAVVVAVRRRRGPGGPDPDDRGDEHEDRGPAVEAW
jgi:hypothetical protein